MAEAPSRVTGVPIVRCPIRLGVPCSQCVPGATGPQDCRLVHLVVYDDRLRDDLASMRADAVGRL
jgi:hypothetical protein